MPTIKSRAVYAVLVHLSSGETIEGYAQHVARSEYGDWFIIGRTPDLMNATYINRQFITHFELTEI